MMVPTSVSRPCPDDVVWIVTVTKPRASILMRQESIQVVCGILLVQQRLERRIAAARLQTGRNADAGQHAGSAQPVALLLHRLEVGVLEHLVDHGVIVAAVVSAAARNEIGNSSLRMKLRRRDFDAWKADRGRHLVDRGLDGVVGRRLTEARTTSCIALLVVTDCARYCTLSIL